MKKLILISILLTITIFAQSNLPDNLVGVHYKYDSQKGYVITTNPLVNNSNNKQILNNKSSVPDNVDSSNSTIRYTFQDPYSVGAVCAEAGNGLSSVIGWMLNTERTSYYNNLNSTAVWEFPLPGQSLPNNYVAITPNGSTVVSSFYQSIYLLNGTNGNQIWNYSITSPDTMYAGPVAITSTGNFIVGSAYAYYGSADTSFIYGFNSSSNVPVWTFRVPPSSMGSTIYGIKISGNDSLIIANTYLNVYVINTFTGQLRYTGTVNPLNNNGTQSQQGISGNGNIIATINYIGYVRVLQWTGTTYNLLWQNQEPPGTYYNWMESVDVSNDGSMVAAGTYNFLSSSNFDGKVKFWSVAGGSTPLWVQTGDSGAVVSVSFSKNGRFLTACSWGSYYTHSVNNLLVFKTSHITNRPWYGANHPGSFFWCSISDDGQTVIGSGKAVHALQFGYGGIFYNLSIDTSENLIGIQNHSTNSPTVYTLNQNYPNPFNPSTLITYQIPKAGNVKISVFNVLGQEVKVLVNEYKQAGEYNVKFDANDFSSGIYFYKIQSGDFTDTKKMTLVK